MLIQDCEFTLIFYIQPTPAQQLMHFFAVPFILHEVPHFLYHKGKRVTPCTLPPALVERFLAKNGCGKELELVVSSAEFP